MKYGDIGNKKLFERYEVETEAGPLATSKMERLIAEDAKYRKMGVANICPRCRNTCAMFLGDSDGEHWCLSCQVEADPEALR